MLCFFYIACDVSITLAEQTSTINIKIDFEPEGEWVYSFNKQSVFEILNNLIDNAIKYNKENGKIYIDFEKKERNIYIKIRDTGIGISEEDQLRVFERFFTVDKSHNKRDSSGLGLAIVKHITRIIGGSIELKSELGKGSEFTLILPI